MEILTRRRRRLQSDCSSAAKVPNTDNYEKLTDWRDSSQFSSISSSSNSTTNCASCSRRWQSHHHHHLHHHHHRKTPSTRSFSILSSLPLTVPRPLPNLLLVVGLLLHVLLGCTTVVGASKVVQNNERLTGQRFAMEPQDQTAVVGSRVTLPCRVIDKEGILQVSFRILLFLVVFYIASLSWFQKS